MSADLVISEDGKVMIARTGRFATDVVRVDYDLTTRRIFLSHSDDHETTHFPTEVSARFSAHVAKAARVLVLALEVGKPVAGYDVPLTCIEAG